MKLRQPSSPVLFRRCPMCGSSALSWAEREGAHDGLVRWLSRCGECWTWRAELLTRRESRRFARHLAQDRRHLADALLRLAWRDPEPDPRAVSRPG